MFKDCAQPLLGAVGMFLPAFAPQEIPGVTFLRDLEIESLEQHQALIGERDQYSRVAMIGQADITLTGEGDLNVDITFENMDDFSPAAIARKVSGLKELLDARMQLDNLMTYMDGKAGAEDLIGKLISDPALLQAVTSATKQASYISVAESRQSYIYNTLLLLYSNTVSSIGISTEVSHNI